MWKILADGLIQRDHVPLDELESGNRSDELGDGRDPEYGIQLNFMRTMLVVVSPAVLVENGVRPAGRRCESRYSSLSRKAIQSVRFHGYTASLVPLRSDRQMASIAAEDHTISSGVIG